MLLLLDEHGDKGLELEGHSSRWLIIAGCLFASRQVAEEHAVRLTELHTQLGGREFHFPKDNHDRRRRVLACVAGFPFTYHVVACDKRRLRIRDWRPDDLYDEVVGQLVDHLKPGLRKCTVWFDPLGGKKSDKRYGQRLCRRAGRTPDGPRIVHTTRMDSRKQPLVQLADYVCGAVSRAIRAEAANADEFRRLIADREGRVIYWPPEDVIESKTG